METAGVELTRLVQILEIDGRALLGFTDSSSSGNSGVAALGDVVQIDDQRGDPLTTHPGQHLAAGIVRIKSLVRRGTPRRPRSATSGAAPRIHRNPGERRDPLLDTLDDRICCARTGSSAAPDIALIAAAADPIDDFGTLHPAAGELDQLVAFRLGEKAVEHRDVRIRERHRDIDVTVVDPDPGARRDPDRLGLVVGTKRAEVTLDPLGHRPDDADRMGGKRGVEPVLDHHARHVRVDAAAHHVGRQPILPRRRQSTDPCRGLGYRHLAHSIELHRLEARGASRAGVRGSG